MSRAGRPSQYRTDAEHLLTVMLTCVLEDNTIPRYLVRNRCGMWLKAKSLDTLIEKLEITVYEREDQWRGKYYQANQVAEKLFIVRKQLDNVEQKIIRESLRPTGTKAW